MNPGGAHRAQAGLTKYRERLHFSPRQAEQLPRSLLDLAHGARRVPRRRAPMATIPQPEPQEPEIPVPDPDDHPERDVPIEPNANGPARTDPAPVPPRAIG
jgi:hypothetical protein